MFRNTIYRRQGCVMAVGHFTSCHGAHRTTKWSGLSPWWHISPPSLCPLGWNFTAAKWCVCAGVSECVRGGQCSHTLSPFALSMPSSLHPTAHPSPSRAFPACRRAEARPGGVDLIPRPSGDTDHYCGSGCLTVQPVIPAQTKIAAATHPLILCLLAVTYALTTVHVIVLYGDSL